MEKGYKNTMRPDQTTDRMTVYDIRGVWYNFIEYETELFEFEAIHYEDCW